MAIVSIGFHTTIKRTNEQTYGASKALMADSMGDYAMRSLFFSIFLMEKDNT